MIGIDRAFVRALHERLDAIGTRPDGGIDRLALSGEDVDARRVVVDLATARGWTASTDPIGNLFVRRGGSGDGPPVLVGSHLDSQPAGGRFDGTTGVVAALAVLDALDRAGAPTTHSVEAVAWCNEEGARFAPATMGSGVYTGAIPLAEALASAAATGETVAAAVAAADRQLPLLRRPGPNAPPLAYLELHIEQGPVLDRRGIPVGVVTGIQGLVWLEVHVRGRSSHAGTTPPDQRADALLRAAELILALDSLRGGWRDDALRLTVGRVVVEPNTPNSVPGSVRFSVDVRHPRAEVLDAVVAAVVTASAGEHPATPSAAEVLHRQAPTVFDAALVDHVGRAADALGLPTHRLPSGATHDAVHLAGCCPTAMVFVPCRAGVSHHPSELTSIEEIATGADVVLEVVRSLAGSP